MEEDGGAQRLFQGVDLLAVGKWYKSHGPRSALVRGMGRRPGSQLHNALDQAKQGGFVRQSSRRK
jgi:hypothetical protein